MLSSLTVQPLFGMITGRSYLVPFIIGSLLLIHDRPIIGAEGKTGPVEVEPFGLILGTMLQFE